MLTVRRKTDRHRQTPDRQGQTDTQIEADRHSQTEADRNKQPEADRNRQPEADVA